MTSTQSITRTQNNTKPAPQRTRAPQGAFVWFELRTPDVARSASFYGEILRWKTETMQLGDQTVTMFANAEETVAHVEPRHGPASFVSYAAVDDVDAAARRVTAAGGTVHGAAYDLPNIGRMVEVSDPDGALFFLYRSATDGAGQPLGLGGFLWNELWARDDRKAVAFLTSVLGYEVEPMPMDGFNYQVLKKGAQSLAGVMPSSEPAAASAWVPYIHVADVDAARARALELGAQPLGDINDVPNVGRMAVMVDPLGARFAVMKPAS